jgi:hypothetical protein
MGRNVAKTKGSSSPSKRKKLGAAAAIARPKSKAEYALNKSQKHEYKRQLAIALGMVDDECTAERKDGAVDRVLASGRVPLVKRATLFRELGKRKQRGRQADLRSILSISEEAILVDYIMLKNQAAQSLSRAEIAKVIIQMLQLREAVNRRGGTIIPLSRAAKIVLANKAVSQAFFARFFADHPELKEGTATQTSQRRAGACTRGAAEKHIAGLNKMLKELGIMEEGGTISVENSRRIFNCDETPQFINYASCTRTLRRVGVKGKRASKYTNENRESVTLSPLISLDGKCALLQVLFAQKYLRRDQVTPAIFNAFKAAGTKLILGCTERGYQTSKSWLDFLGYFDNWLTDEGIPRPVALLLDGHISRFDLAVLTFCRQKKIFVYLSPPDTTGLTQALDQINHALHYHYCAQTGVWERYVQDRLRAQRCREARADLGDDSINLVDDDEDEEAESGSEDEEEQELAAADEEDHEARLAAEKEPITINRSIFLLLLASAWSAFNKVASIIGAFRQVGITRERVSAELMQQDKFKAADMLLNGPTQDELRVASLPGTVTLPLRTRASAVGVDADADVCPDEYQPEATDQRRNTVGYWQHRYEEAEKVNASLRAQLEFFLSRPRPPTLADKEVFPFDLVRQREEGGRKRVGVGIFGSLEEAGALELVQASKNAADAAAAATAQKVAEREAKKLKARETKAAAGAAKEEKLAAYFACIAAAEEELSPCACGFAPAKCKLRRLKLCPTCQTLTNAGCNKKGPCEMARAAAAGASMGPGLPTAT